MPASSSRNHYVPMSEFVTKDGEPVSGICHYCQTRGADARLDDGELYHVDCAPDHLLG